MPRRLVDVTVLTMTGTEYAFFVCALRRIMCWTEEQAPADLRELKSYKVYILPTAELNVFTTEESGKSPTVWKLDNILLNSSWVREEVTGRINTILNSMRIAAQHVQVCGKRLRRNLAFHVKR